MRTTRTMVHERNRRIHSRLGFLRCYSCYSKPKSSRVFEQRDETLSLTLIIKRMHMASRHLFAWCSKRTKCVLLCTKPIFVEFNSFLILTLSFVPINLHGCWIGQCIRSIWAWSNIGFFNSAPATVFSSIPTFPTQNVYPDPTCGLFLENLGNFVDPVAIFLSCMELSSKTSPFCFVSWYFYCLKFKTIMQYLDLDCKHGSGKKQIFGTDYRRGIRERRLWSEFSL